MSVELDDLTRTAAEALVSAMTTESWEAVKDRFVKLIGRNHERRMDAAHAEIAAASGADRRQAQLAQVRAWGTRLRDLLDDSPSAVQGLRALLDELGAPSPWAPPASQHAQANNGSRAVNVGNISGDGVQVIAGDKVEHKANLGLAPFMFIIRSAKRAAAHPIAAAATAAVVLGSATVTAWHAQWPAAVFGTGGAPHSQQAAQDWGDAHPRWQLQVSESGVSGALFIHGMLLLSEPDGVMTRVSAYNEGTGAKAWSRDFATVPVVSDGILLAGTDSTSLSAYRSGSAVVPCPAAITRVNPANGANMWTSPNSGPTGCRPVTASSAYVVAGMTILNASNGSTLQQLAADGVAPILAWAFGNDILVQNGALLQLDALHDGVLQPKWHRNISGYTAEPDYGYANAYVGTADTDYSQIMLRPVTHSTGPWRSEVVNPATGTITQSFTSNAAFTVSGGVIAVSSTGRMIFLSRSEIRTGPKPSGLMSYSGGILWQYQSPGGPGTGPAYTSAIAPGSFKVLGRLETTQSQANAEGNDGHVVSDGNWAAIIAAPVIYVFKL